MIAFLVSATDEGAVNFAAEKGWIRIAYSRFVTDNKDDIRAIRRFADLIAYPPKSLLIKGSDYEEGPKSEILLEGWIREKEKFDKFVSDELGEWIEL